MIALITFTVIIFLFLFFIVKNDRFHDFFSPQILLTVFFIFFYILPAFLFLQGGDFFTKTLGIFFVGTSLTMIDKVNAIMVSFMAFVCLISGIYFSYWLKVFRASSKISVKSEIFWNKMNFYLISFVYLIVGMLETSLFVRFSGGALSTVLNLGKKFEQLSGNYVFTFGYMFLSIIAILLLFREKKVTKLFVLLLIASILSAALIINRGLILIILGLLVISYNYYIKPINLKKIFLIGMLGLLGAVSYKVLQVIIINNWDFKYFSLKYFSSAMAHDLFGDVLIGPQQIAFAFKGIPSFLGFQYGKTIIGFLISFIPSSFFPGKPLVSGAGIYTQSLFPYIFYNGTIIPPGLVGELYMNFSFIGIILGVFLCGIFIGSIYQIMRLKQSVFLIFLYSYAITAFLYLLRGEFLLLSRYIPFVILFWIALRFSSKEKLIFRKRKLGTDENCN